MSRILLAAEANQIQDLIFRSSRLREVTGGSDALEEFWRNAGELPEAGPDGPCRVLVRAGGQMRVLFEGADAVERASRFARDIADVYAMQVGGRISVAMVEDKEGDDAALWKAAAAALASQNEAGAAATAVPGLPYVQPCSSCGVEPAVTVAAEDRSPVCASCADRRAGREPFRNKFLSLLKARPDQQSEGGEGRSPDRDDTRGWKAADALVDLPSETEVGSLDRRRRVAYLLADGNGFGVMFGEAAKQGFDAVAKLSSAASTAGGSALAAATRRLLACFPGELRRTVAKKEDPAGPLSPVLPLITGGDDVFALTPAPWAFWFAREFAGAFAAYMRATTNQEVTISCALVFCKDTFPYRFAHEIGEAALKEAKRVARAHPGQSVVRAVELRSTLSSTALGPPGEYGVFSLGGLELLPVETLFRSRASLAGPGRKRRHQMEELFSSPDCGDEAWMKRAKWLLNREGDEDGSLRNALRDLAGGREELVCSPSLANDVVRSSAAVDLLHLWDYLADPAQPEEGR